MAPSPDDHHGKVHAQRPSRAIRHGIYMCIPLFCNWILITPLRRWACAEICPDRTKHVVKPPRTLERLFAIPHHSIRLTYSSRSILPIDLCNQEINLSPCLHGTSESQRQIGCPSYRDRSVDVLNQPRSCPRPTKGVAMRSGTSREM